MNSVPRRAFSPQAVANLDEAEDTSAPLIIDLKVTESFTANLKVAMKRRKGIAHAKIDIPMVSVEVSAER